MRSLKILRTERRPVNVSCIWLLMLRSSRSRATIQVKNRLAAVRFQDPLPVRREIQIEPITDQFQRRLITMRRLHLKRTIRRPHQPLRPKCFDEASDHGQNIGIGRLLGAEKIKGRQLNVRVAMSSQGRTICRNVRVAKLAITSDPSAMIDDDGRIGKLRCTCGRRREGRRGRSRGTSPSFPSQHVAHIVLHASTVEPTLCSALRRTNPHAANA